MNREQNPSGELLSDHIKKFLKTPPLLLKNFHHEDVMEFLQLGIERHFYAGDVILNESEYINSAYLVVDGTVGVWRDNIQLMAHSNGSFLGETFLFIKNNRLAKVTSEGDSILLKYERYEVLSFFRKKPEKLFNIFTKNIIEIQQKKISNMNDQLLNLKKRLLNDSNWK